MNQKQKYEELEMEIIVFDSADVITESTPDGMEWTPGG